MRIHRILLTCIIASTTRAFYLSFAQYGAAPEIRILHFPNWWNCNPIPSPGATVLGFAIYNNPKQTHYPAGIALFHDPSSQCLGEPVVIVTVSRRSGLFLVDLAELGLDSPYTCWRLYDAAANRYDLQVPAPGTDVYNEVPGLRDRAEEGYGDGSIEDLVFLRNAQTGRWEVVATVRGGPLVDGRYRREFVRRYGEVPGDPSVGQPSKVTPFMKEKLQGWVDEAAAKGPDVKAARYAQYLSDTQEARRPQPQDVDIKVGSMQDMANRLNRPTDVTASSNLDANLLPSPAEVRREQSVLRENIPQYMNEPASPRLQLPEQPAARPWRPRRTRNRVRKPPRLPIPLKVRMRTLLQENVQGQLIIPAPDTLLGQPFGTWSMDPALINAEIAQYVNDVTGKDVELGWALLRAAENRAVQEEDPEARLQAQLEAELGVQQNGGFEDIANAVTPVDSENQDLILGVENEGAGDIAIAGDLQSGVSNRQRSYIEQRLEEEQIESSFQRALRQYYLGSPSEVSVGRDESEELQSDLDDILDGILAQYGRRIGNLGRARRQRSGNAAARGRQSVARTAEIATQTSPERGDVVNNIQPAVNIAEEPISQPPTNSNLQSAVNPDTVDQNAGASAGSQSDSQKFPSPEKLSSQQSRSEDYILRLLRLQNLPSGRTESANSAERLARADLLLGLEPERQPADVNLANLLSTSSPRGGALTGEALRQFRLDVNAAGLSPISGFSLPGTLSGGTGQGPRSSPDEENQEGTGQ
ncbi:hypothetical protein TWF696_000160 [Orbilia brochopaga]|uniref:Uncharacterized protein n=1 Tax=Orbilia brochopaga TaxID=3140254 RepID=A0AAV9VAW2_9PEZI